MPPRVSRPRITTPLPRDIRWPWPEPPANAAPVAMRALDRLLAPPQPGEQGRRLVEPGEPFLAPADRAGVLMVTASAEVLERPDWWPEDTPTARDFWDEQWHRLPDAEASDVDEDELDDVDDDAA